MNDAFERARPLRLMVFDVDGVLTDGTLYYTDEGAELKAFHTLDGLGLKLLQAAGVELALISGRRSNAVVVRAANLGIARLFQGVDDKLVVFERVRGELRLDPRACGFMGDDLPDLPVLTRCGFAATVPEAPEAVRSRAHYVSRAPGGRGAAREVCDLILRAQGALDAAVARFLG
ncbi:MAG TPA: phenylphosphate carboxylase subunit delta [Burkholderiales bacterium]|nr:phenylphosphate carboxylase subunit delta [Burkholderiales bacterium]